MVDTVFQFKAVKPQKLSVASVRANILNALKEEGKYAVSQLNQTIENWNNPPYMDYLIGYKGGDVTMLAGPRGSGFSVKKWHWLNAGTRVRFAHMSTDWVSKTKYGTLASGPGAGYVVIAGRKAGRHPGIEAREWTQLINKKMRKTFHRKIQEAVTKGMRNRA